MSMFNDISWRSKDKNKECGSSAQLVSLYARRFGAGQRSFLGPGSEKKWYFASEDSPQGEWDRVAEQMMLTFAESKHPVFRSTSPLSEEWVKSKGVGQGDGGSPRHATNRRRRTREGPEPACVQTPFMLLVWHMQEEG